jgi:serine/threonine protein kinase
MKMVVIGLDLAVAWISFHLVHDVYLTAGGPSFTVEKFTPEAGNESRSIAELLEAKVMTLVNQTISQTCACQVGDGTATSTIAPTPPVTPGPTVPILPSVTALFTGYHDIEYLDQGVQGAVYSAVSDSDGELVAIKHVKIANENDRNSFTKELSAVRAFSHPACMKYIISKDLGQEAILVTRFEPKGTLDRLLKIESFIQAGDEMLTLKTIIAIGIAFGMEHIHKKGFTHRDLKPANIFLNGDLEPVIGDFGVTTNLTKCASDGQLGPTWFIGTPLHMAPEVWVDESEGYNQSVDVYSYATLLYSLFTPDPAAMLDDDKGNVQNVRDLMKRVAAGARFRRVPEINEAYWDLITSGWREKPHERPTFPEIIDAMIANLPQFLIPNADEAVVRQYIAKMLPLR